MSRADEEVDEELVTPYWHLDRPDGSRRTPRQLLAVTGPVLRLIWRSGRRSAIAILVLQLAAGAAMAGGLLTSVAVLDELLAAGAAPDRLVAAAPGLALVAAILALRGAAEAAVELARARLEPALRRAAEERLFAAALDVRLADFDDADFYDGLHRARDRGLFHLDRAVGNTIDLLGAVCGVTAAVAGLAVLHPLLVPLLVAGMIPEAWAVLTVARRGYAGMRSMVTLDRRVQMLAELSTEREAAAELRACQAEPYVLAEYRQVADVLQKRETQVGVSMARGRTAGRALAGLALAGVLAVLGLMLHAGWIAPAGAGAAVIAVRVAAAALRQLTQAANQLFEQSLYVADYHDFLADADARKPPAAGVPAPRSPGRVTLHGVGFVYPGRQAPALCDIDLTIGAGQTIALVGENGSGKTTLARLLAGLYRPTSGTMRWDGTDTALLDPRTLADRVVLVPQHPVRWPHDARTNVRIGRHDRPDPGDHALREAASLAAAGDVVTGLPAGWQTLLSKHFKGGHELSAGQWQRLAVARGLFRDGALLIWDEPTAPLDAKAEYTVYETLRALAGERTVLLITHRLTSVRHADRIYLLHQGRVAEEGTHEELLALRGHYAELYALQTGKPARR
ncbi:ABC transporter ATP-binding protein [Nonomuraea glycinis]|uniref:ABC transporter ATP-binding protein n=1 Tax=Nonomuraea glycinis TaxID=2047744 RepID=UPI002E1471EA|nr:ATP-binding cassette domain-containing protein [Nonomuraea glycinis]